MSYSFLQEVIPAEVGIQVTQLLTLTSAYLIQPLQVGGVLGAFTTPFQRRPQGTAM